MSRIILAGKNQLTQILQRGLCQTVPEENRHLVHGRIMLQDLVPLTWKLEAAVESGNCAVTTRTAAELMCIPDYKRLKAEEHARWKKSCCYSLEAQPGDVLVVLPFNPTDIPAGSGDGSPFNHEFTFFVALPNDIVGHEVHHSYGYGVEDNAYRGYRSHITTHSFMEEVTPHRSEKTVRQFLKSNKVQVIFVGSRLPADIAHVYRDVGWKRLSLDPPNDLEAMLRRYPNNTVSVFDMVRAVGARDTEFWHRLYFGGRSEVTFSELAAKVDGIMTPQFIKNIATAKLKSMGLTPVSYEHQTAVLKTTFKLPHF